jgi:hypothetical protein
LGIVVPYYYFWSTVVVEGGLAVEKTLWGIGGVMSEKALSSLRDAVAHFARRNT